jgi:CBS domain-containing protein
MNNAKIMTKKVVTVDVDMPIEKALEIMESKKIKELPVVKNKKYVGMVPYYYILTKEINSKSKVNEFMQKTPGVMPRDDISKTIDIMQDSGIGALPVLDEDQKVVGIVSDFDILKVLINDRVFDSFKVDDIAIKKFPILRTDDTLGRAQKLASINKIDNLPIVDNFGKLIAQIPISRIISYTFQEKIKNKKGKKDKYKEEKPASEKNVMELAKMEIPKLSLTLNLRRAIEFMLSYKIKSGIVVDSYNKPVGILSRLKILDLLSGKNLTEVIDLAVSGEYDWEFIVLVRNEITKRENFLIKSAKITSIKINVKKIKKAGDIYQINMLAIGKKRINIKADGVTKELVFEDVIDKLDNALEHLKE